MSETQSKVGEGELLSLQLQQMNASLKASEEKNRELEGKVASLSRQIDSISENIRTLRNDDRIMVGKLEDLPKIEKDLQVLTKEVDGNSTEINKINELLAGDETGNFGLIQIRSIIRALQSNTKFLGRGVSAVGLGGLITIIGAFTGWGKTGNQEFVYLESYHALEAEVEAMQLTLSNWETTVEKAKAKLVFENPE